MVSYASATDKEALLSKLFDIGAVKFGEFKIKSGSLSPVYFDLRVIVSYPNVMELITNQLNDLINEDGSNYDHLCGVPYTALPLATLLSVKTNKPMLMRRKEAKSYGTKNMIEGHYRPNDMCLIIEDVITSGSSVLETVNDLRREGLSIEKAIVILDREQGGRQNLLNHGIQVKSLISITELLDILVKLNKIDSTMADKVKSYILESNISPPTSIKHDRTKMSFEKRAEQATNSIAKQLFTLMAEKKTNLCLSVDLTSSTKILELIKQVGHHVCLIKTHVDIIEDFNDDFIQQLKELSSKLKFVILEDRKFADIGNTVSLQYSKGMYKIGEWADCVTVHSLPGEGVLKAISAVSGNNKGVFLLAEMSSEGNLITDNYRTLTSKMAAKYPEIMTGFVCQSKDTYSDPGLIQLTPGVQLNTSGDNLGQVYNTPEKIMLEKGADIAVVGRGIVDAADPLAQTLIYKEKLWKSYEQRIQ